VQHLYVIGRERQFLGAISLQDIREFLDQPELENMLIAADIVNENFPRISPDQGISEVFEKFSVVRSERLPVVDNLDANRLIGSISKTDIMLFLAGKQGS
jgi:chloride channel protein, CIC family